MAITITPTISEADDGSEYINDYSVNNHNELHHGLAPAAVWYDDTTGDFVYDIPTEHQRRDDWEYVADDFENHPVLGATTTDQEAALYWLDHRTPMTTSELSAMLDGLEYFNGQDRIDLESLIAFKCGDLQFRDLALELQEQLIEATETTIEPQLRDDQLDQELVDAFTELTTAPVQPEIIPVLESIAADSADYGIAVVASLSSRFHNGEDPELLIEEAVTTLGIEVALNAHYRLTNILSNNDY